MSTTAAVDDQHLDEDHTPARRPTIEEIIGAALMIGMVIILFIQVVSRFVFSNSLSWSEEISRYMFIWLIYLCLGVVALRGEHIVIDVLVLRMEPRLRRILHTVALGIALVLNIFLLVVAADIAHSIQQIGQTSAALGLPMWTVYAALPVGMLIAIVRTVQALVRLWRGGPDAASESASALDDPVIESADPLLSRSGPGGRPTATTDVEGDVR